MVAGRFSIEALLGRGVLGEVYRATQLAMGRAVALKLLRAESLRSEHARSRFEQEARLLGRLAHPNIVQVFDFGIDEATHRPFIALELVTGSTLLELLRGSGRVTEASAARICEQIARALAHAHRHGVVHRDLKPANVMLSDLADGRAPLVKVLDFGLGKLLARDEARLRLTTPGQMLGTPSFASPEQALGDEVDERSDLYALGCLAFALVSGRAPHAAADPLETLRLKRSAATPELPATLADGAAPSAEFDAIYRRLLARRPSERPASALEVAESLATIAEDAEQRTAAVRVAVPDGPTDVATRATVIGAPAAARLQQTTRDPIVRSRVADTALSFDDRATARAHEDDHAEALPDTAPGVPPDEHGDAEALPDTAPGVRPDEHGDAEALPDTAPGVPPDTTPGVARSADANSDTLADTEPGLYASRDVLPEVALAGASDSNSSRLPLALAATAALIAVAALAATRVQSPGPAPAVEAPAATAAPAVEIAPRPVRRVHIESSPSGAEVIEGGESIGTTPLVLERPAEAFPIALSLELARHRSEAIELTQTGPDRVRVTLRPVVRTPPPPRPARDGGAGGYPVW